MRESGLTPRVTRARKRKAKAKTTPAKGRRQGQRRAAVAGRTGLRGKGRKGSPKRTTEPRARKGGTKAKAATGRKGPKAAKTPPKAEGKTAKARRPTSHGTRGRKGTGPRRSVHSVATREPGAAARAFVNARVLPMGPPRDGKPGWEVEHQAILWQGDTILAVGSDAEIRAQSKRIGAKVEDLAGRVVLPGFVDAHTHFLHVGVKRTRPDLRGAKSLREALQRLARFLHDHPGSHHVIGEGWDESEWTPGRGEAGPDGKARRPTRDDLDAVIAAAAKDGLGPIDRPVVLRRICGHIAVASSGALPLVRARWDDDAAVDLRSGLLTEAPSLYLNEALPSTPAELDRAVAKACEVAHRVGITTVGDYSQAPYRAALQRAAARGTLSVRVAGSVYVQQLDTEVAAGFRTGRPGLAPGDLTAGARKALQAGAPGGSGGGGAGSGRMSPDAAGAAGSAPGGSHFGPVPGRDGGDRLTGGSSPWLRDGGLKVFLDGSLGGHTAHLREPYLDVPDPGAKDPHAGHDHGPAWARQGGKASRPAAQGAGTGAAAPANDPTPDPADGARPGCGSRIWTDAHLDHHFGTAHANGIQVHAHAIGDAAVDQGLDAYARLAAHESLEGRGWAVEAMPRLPGRMPGEEDRMPDPVDLASFGQAPVERKQGGSTGLRHRFEHYEIVHDDQVARTVELGIVASSQPNFVGEWSAKGGMYHARLGDRYRLNNRFRSFLDAGIPLAFGSDGMPFGPLVGLQSALHHPDPTQRLTPGEAVWHYTTGAAWSLHWEDDVGALLPGMKADLVVLDRKDLDGTPTQWVLKETVSGGTSQGGNKQPVPSL